MRKQKRKKYKLIAVAAIKARKGYRDAMNAIYGSGFVTDKLYDPIIPIHDVGFGEISRDWVSDSDID